MKQKLLEDVGEICSLSSLPLGQSDVLSLNNSKKNAILVSILSSSEVTPPSNPSLMTDLTCLREKMLPIHSQMLHPMGLIAIYSRKRTRKF